MPSPDPARGTGLPTAERGTLLAWSGAVMSGGAYGYLALTWLLGLADARHLVGGVGFTAGLLAAALLARAGRVRAAAWVLVGSLSVVIAGLVYGEGIASTTVSVFYLVTMLTALLLGPREGLTVALVCGGYVVVVGELQADRPPVAALPLRVMEVGLALQLLMAGLLSSVFAARYRARGERLEAGQRDLVRRNEELEAQRRLLRVRAREDQVLAEVARRGIAGEPVDEIEHWARQVQRSDLGADDPPDALTSLNRPAARFDQAVETLITFARERTRAQRVDAVGRLAGGIAHDFNNLLTVILGGLEAALESPDLPEEARQDLADAEKAAHRAAAMTQRLLSFGRPRSGPPARVELGSAVDELSSILRRLVGEAVEIVVRREPAPLVISVDPALVEQAVMNLVVNAHEAMPHGGRVTVSVSAAVEADGVPGDWVLLSVRDEGAGMEREVAARLFEPLFTTKGHGGGTGLGLAAVTALVEAAHGRVSVHSEPGVGTDFRLWLPRLDLTPPPGATNDPAPERAGGLILVVDDDPAVGSAIRLMLVRARYEVALVETLDEALATTEARGSALRGLVTDVGLRGTTGREVADRVRERVPGLPVLFVSGHPQGAFELGVGDGWLSKPFGKDELLRELAALMPGRAERAAPRTTPEEP